MRVASMMDNFVGLWICLGLAGLVVLLGFIGDYILRRGQGLEVESHWGGLGGATVGMRMSPPTVLVVLAIALAAVIVAATETREVKNAGRVVAEELSKLDADRGARSTPRDEQPQAAGY